MDVSVVNFEKFIHEAEKYACTSPKIVGKRISDEPLLNGHPYAEFRRHVDIEFRRSRGCFFSGQDIANKLAGALTDILPSSAKIIDPTCGIGDLLLGYANSLPIKKELTETLYWWGEALIGIDLDARLVKLTKIRLLLLAKYRGGFSGPVWGVDKLFPNIICGDMFDQAELIQQCDGILSNPPFCSVDRAEHSAWGSGLVNSAALFLEFILKNKKAGAPVSIVLPEVLRCGTRYSRFRKHVVATGVSGPAQSVGQFDAWTDVDVFLTLLRDGSGGALWNSRGVSTSKTLGDFFDVRVGPVVPHRETGKGPWRPYICARSLPAWRREYSTEIHKRFTGTVFTPPFVAVRRTSRPGDRHRAVGTIVLGNKPVAVENHLLVLLPKSGGQKQCRLALKLLQQKETADFLNSVMRCRHLTTVSIRSIPWLFNDD